LQLDLKCAVQAIQAEKKGGLNGAALYVMAGKTVNEKRFSEMKGK